MNLPPIDPPPPPDLSPEGRRREALRWRAEFEEALGPRDGALRRTIEVLHRVWLGVYHDGFIHAGNLAYMSILALFPFFITMGAIYSLVGEESERSRQSTSCWRRCPPWWAKCWNRWRAGWSMPATAGCCGSAQAWGCGPSPA